MKNELFIKSTIFLLVLAVGCAKPQVTKNNNSASESEKKVLEDKLKKAQDDLTAALASSPKNTKEVKELEDKLKKVQDDLTAALASPPKNTTEIKDYEDKLKKLEAENTKLKAKLEELNKKLGITPPKEISVKAATVIKELETDYKPGKVTETLKVLADEKNEEAAIKAYNTITEKMVELYKAGADQATIDKTFGDLSKFDDNMFLSATIAKHNQEIVAKVTEEIINKGKTYYEELINDKDPNRLANSPILYLTKIDENKFSHDLKPNNNKPGVATLLLNTMSDFIKSASLSDLYAVIHFLGAKKELMKHKSFEEFIAGIKDKILEFEQVGKQDGIKLSKHVKDNFEKNLLSGQLKNYFAIDYPARVKEITDNYKKSFEDLSKENIAEIAKTSPIVNILRWDVAKLASLTLDQKEELKKYTNNASADQLKAVLYKLTDAGYLIGNAGQINSYANYLYTEINGKSSGSAQTNFDIKRFNQHKLPNFDKDFL